MRKRYGKARHRSPYWKWTPKDEAVLKEFERESKGGRPFVLNRIPPVRHRNPTWEEVRAELLADDPELQVLHDRDELVVETIRRVLRDRHLDPLLAQLFANAVIDALEDEGWL